MDDIRQRLLGCFSAIFSNLSEEEICSATPDRVAAWDSVAMATLLALVEEEFGVRLGYQEMDHMDSFASFYRRLAPDAEG